VSIQLENRSEFHIILIADPKLIFTSAIGFEKRTTVIDMIAMI